MISRKLSPLMDPRRIRNLGISTEPGPRSSAAYHLDSNVENPLNRPFAASFLARRKLLASASSAYQLTIKSPTQALPIWDVNHLTIDIISYIMSQMPAFAEQTCSDRPAPKWVSLLTLGFCAAIWLH